MTVSQRTISDVLFSLSELHDKLDRVLDALGDRRTSMAQAGVFIDECAGNEVVPTDEGGER